MMGKVVPPIQDKDTHRRAGRDALDRPLVKRFYEKAAVSEKEGLYAVELDGRPVRTPSRSPLAVPSPALARGLCDEWTGQEEWVDPDAMPLNKLANTVLDRVSLHMDEVRNAVLEFAGSDLLCYRAEAPVELAQKQADAWDPVLAWLKEKFGAEFKTGVGIAHVAQPEGATRIIDGHLKKLSAFELAPLHVMTSLTGSLFLALAMDDGMLSPEQAWDAAHVDEDWQIAQWGGDEEAQDRREGRLKELRSAMRFLDLYRS